MTNHVHLILCPGDDADALSKLMKRLAGRQTRYVNKQERRTGSLWKGRFKPSPIPTDHYILHSCRCVELNLVIALKEVCTEAYRWTSFLCMVRP